jgi:D-beta-D-heptose 7-phosphate kinase/D-beta-D-heptose 1-phosphate adenosyltransferase
MAGRSVLVVGDLILDHYLWGSVERTAPEAPVPVVRHERDTWGLGAAANVAQNIQTLGGRALLVGVVGKNEGGERLKAMLGDAGISTTGVVASADRPTTMKTRVISVGQPLLRIDREVTDPLPPAVVDRVVRAIERLAARSQAILLSDYLKGVLGAKVIAAAMRAGRKHKIPVLVDPKGRDYERYRGASVLTPNRRELSLAADSDDVNHAGRKLMKQCGLGALVVTMDAEGLAVVRPGRKVRHLPAQAPEVSDPTGGGDTTIAALALALAGELDLDDAANIANHAGGIAVSKLGVATVSAEEVRAVLSGGAYRSKVRTPEDLKITLANLQGKGRKVVFTNGCFDLLHPGHIRFLRAAGQLGDVLVVGLNTDRSVRALKGAQRPIITQNERAAILSALEVVDFVVPFDELTPENLLRELRPDILAKGRNIPEDQVVGREIVESYGGRVSRLPILHTASITDLVDSIVGKSGRRR